MFNNFTDIDRQTVLNDGVPDTKNAMGMNVPGGDGALTGLVASEMQPTTDHGPGDHFGQRRSFLQRSAGNTWNAPPTSTPALRTERDLREPPRPALTSM